MEQRLNCTYWAFPGLISSMNSDAIINHVCNRLGMSRADIMQKTRKRDIVDARRICINAIKNNNQRISLKRIGFIFNLDHATVLHCLKTYKILFETDTYFQKKVQLVYREPIILIS